MINNLLKLFNKPEDDVNFLFGFLVHFFTHVIFDGFEGGKLENQLGQLPERVQHLVVFAVLIFVDEVYDDRQNGWPYLSHVGC